MPAKRTSKRSARTLVEIFGVNVRLERVRQQLTQEQLANRARFDQGFISLVERGLVAASLDSVERIARALEVDPAQLVDRTLGRGVAAGR